MSRRSPRSPAAPRPDDAEASPALAGDALPNGIGDPAATADGLAGLDPDDDAALLGAYALGALSPEERVAVEDRLAASPALQAELRRLIPVAALLREATDAPPAPTEHPEPSRARRSDPAPNSADLAPVAPSRSAPISEDTAIGGPATPSPRTDSEIHDAVAPRTVAVVVADHPSARMAPETQGGVGAIRAEYLPSPLSEDHGPTPEPVTGDLVTEDRTEDRGDDDAPVDDAPATVRVGAAPGSLSSRPAGRRARTAEATRTARPRKARAATRLGGWPVSWVAAGLATLVAVGAVLWALALVDRLDTRGTEADALATELGELRARGDAAVVALAPAEGGPAGADGVVVVVPSEGSLLVRVAGLPASAEGRVYQVWFQDAVEETERPWVVGPIFRVGQGGTALVELPAAAPSFTRVALSDEPSPGGDAPTGPFLLEGVTTTGA